MPFDPGLFASTNHHSHESSDPLASSFGIKRIYFAASNKDYKLDCNEGDKENCTQECAREFPGDALATKECGNAVERAYSL